MTVAKGDVVLVPFPFTNLQQTKLRPALVLWADSSGQDVTLCFISSQNLSNLGVGEFVLDSSNPEFTSTGLKVDSKVRVTRIATLESRLIARRLGKLGAEQIHLKKEFICVERSIAFCERLGVRKRDHILTDNLTTVFSLVALWHNG